MLLSPRAERRKPVSIVFSKQKYPSANVLFTTTTTTTASPQDPLSRSTSRLSQLSAFSLSPHLIARSHSHFSHPYLYPHHYYHSRPVPSATVLPRSPSTTHPRPARRPTAAVKGTYRLWRSRCLYPSPSQWKRYHVRSMPVNCAARVVRKAERCEGTATDATDGAMY